MQVQRIARAVTLCANVFLLSTFSVAGCSSRAAYENIQLNERRECSALPPSEYDECMQALDKSYEEYRKEREEVLND